MASLPAIRTLCRKRPDRHLVVTSRSGALLISTLDANLELVLLEDGDWENPLHPWSVYRLVKSIRKLSQERFDLVFDFHGTIATRLLALWMTPSRSISVDLRFPPCRRPRGARGAGVRPSNAVQRYLSVVVEDSRESEGQQVRLNLPPHYAETAEALLLDREWDRGEVLVAIAPAPGPRRGGWPGSRYIELVSRLVNVFNWSPVLLQPGIPVHELKQLAELRSRVWVYRPRDILERAAVLSRCSGVIAEDDCTAHLAAGVGTPVILLDALPGFELTSPKHIQWSHGFPIQVSCDEVLQALSTIVHKGRSSTLFDD
ncbi:MAG: glycosyltransferase family 9 protein [Acidobacteria bacterium]|nr:glycosyltransferase family 9 protein [Acidobacteriota bacterium]